MKLWDLSSWSSVQLCLAFGLISLFFLVEINLELTDYSLFVPLSQVDTFLPNETSELHRGFLVYTNGCRIAHLDPMDVSVRKFIVREQPVDCERQYGPALVESNLTSLYVNLAALSHYNVTDVRELDCCYQPFWRVEHKRSPTAEYPNNVDSMVKFGKSCIEFVGETDVMEEFVKVKCSLGGKEIFLDFHAFTPIKSQAVESDPDRVSVLIVGADAVSRLNLHRQMPQTLDFLKNALHAVEMLGFNKVGDNTFPNLIPVFTGLFEEELVKKCWPTIESVFDNCSFIWDNFKRLNYSTAYAEDSSWMGIFNYLKYGFRKQPTDYYMRIFNKVAEDKIGSSKRLNANLCIGSRKSLQTLLIYSYKFAVTLKNVLSFGFFWGTSLTHDYLNLAQQGDLDYKMFFESLYSAGVLNNTVLVFMSDHGIRWGEIRKTYQGYLEERLPFLFIVYPEWFKIKYTTAISNLKKNRHRLTTPFDLHETLLDLLDLTSLEQRSLKKRSFQLTEREFLPRGMSLFLPVPGSRSCNDAGIVDHWCTCHQSTQVATNSSEVQQAAKYLVGHMNSLLNDLSGQCATLSLKKVLNARTESTRTDASVSSKSAGITDYSLGIETVPGKGIFEATVRYNPNSGDHAIVGSISRINLYGQQSSCIHNYKLRLYCYCKK